MSTYKKKATKNIIISVVFKVIILVTGLVSRRYMVNYLGDEITGIYSLFVSILGFLAVAELGVGFAISFSMYKPIVDNDKDKISALFYLYKKIYLIVFGVIVVVGMGIMPFLPLLAKEYTIGTEIYYTYFVFLLATVITYLYAYKTSFINAHMDNYITNSIRSIFQIIEYIIQVVIIILTKSFFWFLIVILISNVLQWITTDIIFKKRYKNKINNSRELSKETKGDIVKKTKAMFFHKIGGLLVVTIDNLVIGAFIGVVLLGKYSNYVLIIKSMIGVLGLVFTSMVSVLGQLYAKVPKEKYNDIFNKMYLLNYIMAVVFMLGFYSISQEVITILFNKEVLLDNTTVIVLTINYFLWFFKQAAVSFRDASGIFYYDRYKPLFEGAANLILSLVLVKLLGLPGVVLATVITNATINHIVEPFILYKYAFEASPRKYYLLNYVGIALFVALLFGFSYIPFPNFDNIYVSLLVKGSASVLVSVVFILSLYLTSKTVRKNMNGLFNEVIKFVKKKKV